MSNIFKNPYKSKNKKITPLYLVGDDGSDKAALYNHFGITPPDEGQEITINIHQLS